MRGVLFLINTVVVAATLAVPPSAAATEVEPVRWQVGNVKYSIPTSYGASGSENSLFVSVSLPRWGPLIDDKPGWGDHLQILITQTNDQNIAALWDRLYDGSPLVPGKPYTIVKQYRSDPNFVVRETASGDDVFLPDQDANVMPEGFIVCGRPKPPMFPYASCAHYFIQNHQRWKITFGRQFLGDFRSIRDRADKLLDGFKEE